MCGRYTLTHEQQEIEDRFLASLASESASREPRYNIAPTQQVITVRDTDGRHLEAMRWGIVPAWAKDSNRPLINIRADTLATKPYFQNALVKRRCIIPASGFYEWKEADNPGEGGKTPIYFQPTDRGLLGFAGIWEESRGVDGTPRVTCAIVTTEPNALLGLVHNRMPVIVPPGAQDLWLDSTNTDRGDLLAILAPYTDGQLEAAPVSRMVNSPANDSPQCVEATGKILQAF